MTVRKAAMVGLDGGKTAAPARCGGRKGACVVDRRSPPPAGSGGRSAAMARSPLSDRRGRLADVCGHAMSAGPGAGPGHPGRSFRAWSAQGLGRSRSRASWASRRLRRWVIRARWPARRATSAHARARAATDADNASLTFGTNRELSRFGRARWSGGGAPPRIMRRDQVRKVSSRRPGWGEGSTRRRDAQPARSGGWRGRELGSGEASSHAPAAGWMTRTSWRSGRKSETVTEPPERRSILIAKSVVSPSPDSRRLTWPLDRKPRRAAKSACDQPRDFRHVSK